MEIYFMKRRVKPSVAIACVLFLAACGGGGGALLSTSGIFGPTVDAAQARARLTGEPLSLNALQQFIAEQGGEAAARQKSLTTDPILLNL